MPNEFIPPETTFEVSHDSDPSNVLIAGFSSFGLAGLTAVDFLVDQLDLEETGYVRTEGLPTITPFENGRPRHPTRLFSRSDIDVTVLVGELLVPAPLGEPFSRSILQWTEANGVEEIAVLAGVPIPHDPAGHRTYYIATDDYREKRLSTGEVEPMGQGFLDGTNGALIEQGIDSPLGVSVFVTPVHHMSPDVEATIRLVETIDAIYDLGVDAAPLEAFAEEIRQYYSELSRRIEETERELPEDRMYM